MTPFKVNYDFIDLIKCIAIFFVIAYHFNISDMDFISSPDNSMVYINYFIQTSFCVCVPLFFLVNGALLINKPIDIKKQSIKLLKIICITLFWSVINVVALMYIRNEFFSFKEFINIVLFFKLQWNNHLWFLKSLFVLYVFYPLITLCYQKEIKIFYYFFILCFIFSFFNNFLSLIINVVELTFLKVDRLKGNYNFFENFNAVKEMGYIFVYFMLGRILFEKRNFLSDKKYKILSFFVLIFSTFFYFLYAVFTSFLDNTLFDLVWFGYDSPFALVNVIAIFILSLSYTNNHLFGKYIKIISKNTLGIYVLHIPIGFFLKPFFTDFYLAGTPLLSFVFALVILVCSSFLAYLGSKTSIIRELLKL